MTDGGLAHLQALPNLRELWLSNNSQVTDAGIDHLNKLLHLRDLRFDHRQFTDEGVRRLKEALPMCNITRRQR